MKRTVSTLAVAMLIVGLVAVPASAKHMDDKPNIVETALAVNADTGEFDTLIAAVVSAGLVDALTAPGAKTVWAPTDAAFAALGLDETNIGTLPVDVLTDILLYHVSAGGQTAGKILARGGGELTMLNGGTTSVTTDAGVQINGANVVIADVFASNGVIHVIDAVLLP